MHYHVSLHCWAVTNQQCFSHPPFSLFVLPFKLQNNFRPFPFIFHSQQFFAFRSNKINKTFHCKRKPATMCYPESFALLTSTFSCKMQPSSKLSADFQIEDPCVTGNSCSVSGRTKSFSTSVCLFGGLSE